MELNPNCFLAPLDVNSDALYTEYLMSSLSLSVVANFSNSWTSAFLIPVGWGDFEFAKIDYLQNEKI